MLKAKQKLTVISYFKLKKLTIHYIVKQKVSFPMFKTYNSHLLTVINVYFILLLIFEIIKILKFNKII